jgi:XTP/dITP diphosphohydrolase
MQFVFATHNLHKLEEVKTLLNSNITVLSLKDINYTDEIEENETTLEGNALIKAKTIFKSIQENCFADDSGLLVDALNGEPGVYSARYAGSQKNDNDNMNKLLDKLKDIENRKAQFKTVLALILNEKEYLFEGIVHGVIAHEKKGTKGFGYDPIFIPEGFSKSFAELTSLEKSMISHRSIALKKLITFLQNK